MRNLVANLTAPGAPSTMKLMLLNTIERKHVVAWRTRKQNVQLPRMVSHVLMSSNA